MNEYESALFYNDKLRAKCLELRGERNDLRQKLGVIQDGIDNLFWVIIDLYQSNRIEKSEYHYLWDELYKINGGE